ncbi:MAG TPA: methyltransferase domain-containing protein [Syntrophales bacterium]|nr:methyltransferase domain-containing protein [Syntrophales bacterium]
MKALIFTEEIAQSYDAWRDTPTGRYIDSREKSLILDLTQPRGGERLLDVGCGTGDHLWLFRRKGCDVTGLDSSPPMLERARRKLGNKADFFLGDAEDLPFSDNEFDIVTLITSLEFTVHPMQAINEAIRVCRGRVFIGVLNRFSCLGLLRPVTGAFGPSIYNRARFFSSPELVSMIRRQLAGVRIRRGSVIFLPYGWYGFASGLEELIPVMNNPFGAFLGLSFPVTFTQVTIQEPIREVLNLGAEGRRPVPGVVRVIK